MRMTDFRKCINDFGINYILISDCCLAVQLARERTGKIFFCNWILYLIIVIK